MMPPTLSEHLLTKTERALTQSEPPFLQFEHPLILAEPLLIQSERALTQSEHPFLHAELPLKLFACCDTVIANHEISVSSHETVISCPAFPNMVISIMKDSHSAPLCA